MSVAVGPRSTTVICPSCQAKVNTRVTRKVNTRTHLLALLLCVFGCWCCSCIPYCADSFQNADHYCPNCNTYIGTYQH